MERLHQRVVKPLHDFEHLRQKKMIGFPWLGLLSSCFISVVIAGFIFYKYCLGSKEAEVNPSSVRWYAPWLDLLALLCTGGAQ